MPERNLVAYFNLQRTVYIEVAFFFAVALSSGCSRINSKGLRDLIDQQPPVSDWHDAGEDEFERRLLQEPDSFETMAAENSLKSAANNAAANGQSVTQENGPIRLSATTTPTSGNTDQHSDNQTCTSVQCTNPACNHNRTKPRLPFAEPMEPPVSTQSPPAAIVGQPLTPILFDAETRVVKIASPSNLRSDEAWSIENVASLESKPEVQFAPVPAELTNLPVAVNPIRPDRPVRSTVPNRMADNLAFLTSSSVTGPAVVPTSSAADAASIDAEIHSRRRAISQTTAAPVVAEATSVRTQAGKKTNLQDKQSNEFVANSNPPVADFPSRDEMTSLTNSSDFAPAKPTSQKVSLTTNQATNQNSIRVGQLKSLTNNLQTKPNSTQQVSQPQLVRVEDLTDQEFDELFGLSAGDSSRQPICASCGKAHCSGCFTCNKSDSSTACQPKTEIASNDFDGELVQASHVETLTSLAVPVAIPPTATWQAQIRQTIQTVQQKWLDESDQQAKNGHEVNLRLLQVLERNMNAVEEKGKTFTPIEQGYWQHQLEAINTFIEAKDQNAVDADSQNASADSNAAAVAGLAHLRQAVEQLEAIVGLKLNNAEFCSEIKGFGQVQPFASTKFIPNQRVLVYCEVENYQASETQIPNGSEFVTRLQGRYRIIDQQGRRVQKGDFPIVEDRALSKRRDFYLYFPIAFENLPPGQYKLELHVQDLTARSSAQTNPSLEFSVE